jgi:hypothetical protein
MLTKENGIKLVAAVAGLYAGYSMFAAFGSIALSGIGFVCSASVALAAYTAFNHVAELINSANTKKTSEFVYDYYTLAQKDASDIYKHGEKFVSEASIAVEQNHSALMLSLTSQGNGTEWLNQIRSAFRCL